MPRVICKDVKIQGIKLPPRWGHSAVERNGQIYVFGGRNETDLNDLYSFDVRTHTWINKFNQDSVIPRARRRHSAVFIGRTMILFGGFDGTYFNDMYYINVEPFWIDQRKDNIHQQYLSLVDNQKFADVKFILEYDEGIGSIFSTKKTEIVYGHSCLVLYRLTNETCRLHHLHDT